MHFRKSGRFFRSLKIVDGTAQGAGELGPLAGATHSRVVKTHRHPNSMRFVVIGKVVIHWKKAGAFALGECGVSLVMNNASSKCQDIPEIG